MKRIYVFLIPFCFDCAMSFFWLGVSHWLLNIGGSQEQLGLLTSAIYGIQIPFYIYIGKLIKNIGKTQLLVTGLAMVVLFTLYLGYIKLIPCFVVLACCVTIGHAFFYPVFESIMTDYSDEKKASGDSTFFNIGWCGGSCVAAILSPILIKYFEHTSIGLKILGFACLLFGIFVLIFIIANAFDLRNKEMTQFEKINESEVVPNNEVYLNSARIASFLGCIATPIFLFIFPKIFADIGWSTSKIVTLSGMTFNGVAVGVVICLFLKFWKSNLMIDYATIFILLLLSVFCIFYKECYILLCVLVFLAGVASGFVSNAGLFHTMCSPAEERDRNFGILSGIASVGAVITGLLSFVGGYFYNIYHYNWLISINLYLVIILSLISFIIIFLSSKKLR